MPGQHDDLALESPGLKIFECVDPAPVRQAYVEENDIKVGLVAKLEGPGGRFGRGDLREGMG